MAHWEEIRHEKRVNERVNVAAVWLPCGCRVAAEWLE